MNKNQVEHAMNQLKNIAQDEVNKRTKQKEASAIVFDAFKKMKLTGDQVFGLDLNFGKYGTCIDKLLQRFPELDAVYQKQKAAQESEEKNLFGIKTKMTNECKRLNSIFILDRKSDGMKIIEQFKKFCKEVK